LLIGDISERTKLLWAHNTLFFMCLTHLSTLITTYQQFHTTTYIFSFVIMSSFLLKKKLREALFFCFNLKKSTAESHWIFGEAYGDNVLSEITCRDWFRRFNANNFDLSDKKRENRPRKVEDCQLQALLDEDDRKKCLPSNWAFLKQSFPCGYMPWRRFKRSENGCHMNWTIGWWSDAKTHAKFCLPDKKKSRSCIGLWQAMKSGSIFKILNARNLGLIQPNHQHLPQD